MKILVAPIIVLLLLLPEISFGQNKEISKILSQREASNQALRVFDDELNATFSTEDALITTGAGKLISGKKELINYIQESTGPKMYWIRTPDEVIVNPKTNLAWETGTWKGYYEDSEKSVVGGKYSAQWTKASGIWLIQSQLFVTLENSMVTDPDETAVKKLVESFLVAIGNGDLDAIEPMFMSRATIGGASFKDEKWNTFTTTIEDYLARNRNNHVPHTEPVSNYTIHISAGQLAFVKADAILYREGKAQSHNMDFFTLLKDNGTWKFLSAANTAKPIINK